MALKQKTIDYLNTSARTVDTLLAKAIEYKTKYNASHTGAAKELYRKRLLKTIKQLEPYMKMFKSLEELNKMPKVDTDTTKEQ